MKKESLVRHWSNMILLALFTVVLHSVLKTPGQTTPNNCSCGAAVGINNKWWFADCDGSPYQAPACIPIGGYALVGGAAVAGNPNCAPERTYSGDLDFVDRL